MDLRSDHRDVLLRPRAPQSDSTVRLTSTLEDGPRKGESGLSTDIGQWKRYDRDLRRREVTTIRQALVEGNFINVTDLDTDIDKVTGTDDGGAEEDLRSAFSAASARPGWAGLLATYLYATAQMWWELVSDYERIASLARAARSAADIALGPAGADPVERELVGLMLDLASSLVPAMGVENALNCSCPIGMSEEAGLVLARANDVLERLERVPEGHDGFRNLIRTRALIDKYYFSAVESVCAGVLAYIDGGPSAARIIATKIADVTRAERDSVLRGDVYRSELRTHRLTLEALEKAWPRIFVNSAKIIYCYPFAVRGVDPRALIKLVEQQPPTWRLLGQIPSVSQTNLSDLWEGTARDNDRWAGITIALPPLTIQTTAPPPEKGFDVEIRLSQLGNHYVRVEKWLENADVHELHQMMRRSASQMGREPVSFDPTADGVDTSAGTSSAPDRLADFARALIDDLFGRLRTSTAQELHLSSPPTTHHVIVAARRLSLETSPLDVAFGTRLDTDLNGIAAAHGAALLVHPIRQAAAALEEWVRYPVPPAPIIASRNLLDGFAFTGDFMYRTANTTFALFGGMPEFLMRDHEQAAEFVASLPALLQSWLEEIRAIRDEPFSFDEGPEARAASARRSTTRAADNLQTINDRKLALRRAITAARTMLATIRSPGLCLTAVQRVLLDRLFESAGVSRLEQELQAQFQVANDYLEELSGRQARIETERTDAADHQQDTIILRLGIATALFGAASFAGIFQLLNPELQPTFHEILYGECLGLVAAAALLLAVLWLQGRSIPRWLSRVRKRVKGAARR